MSITVVVDALYRQPGRDAPQGNTSLLIDDGRPEAVLIGGQGRIAMPAPANAHDHGRALSCVASGAADAPLEVWIPTAGLLPAIDAELEATVALGRMAAGGIAATQICLDDFDYAAMPRRVEAMARVARKIGIRLALSLPVIDQNVLGYFDAAEAEALHAPEDWAAITAAAPYLPPVAEQLDVIDGIAAVEEHGGVTIQYHAIGLTWCSLDALALVSERSRQGNRRIHMHMLETLRQRHWIDVHLGADAFQTLDSIGLLSDRLGCAHGVQLREAEIALLAERGVTLSLNTSSNLRLGSGMAPVPLFIRHGLRFGLGLDSFGASDRADIWQELRLARLVHGGDAMVRALPDDLLFAAAIAGNRLIDRPSQDPLRDIVVLDLNRLAPDRLDCADPLALVTARAEAGHVSDLIVDNRLVVSDGQVLGVDLPLAERSLRQAVRSKAVPAGTGLIRRHADAIRRYYR